MNDIELVPVAKYKEALKTPLRRDDLSTGLIYDVLFCIKYRRDMAIRFCALLSELPDSETAKLLIVDSDFRPFKSQMHVGISDGVLHFDGLTPIGMACTFEGDDVNVVLEKGVLSRLDDPFEELAGAGNNG